MRELRLSAPHLGLIGATRGLLGIGIGLLLAARLRRRQRRILGTSLALAGGLSTIPLGIALMRRQRKLRTMDSRPGVAAAFYEESITAD